MEKLTLETLSAMSKEELIEAVQTLQTKLEVAEKEVSALKADAEIGKKYKEHLLQEAIRLVKLVDGEKAPILTLLEKADVDTLKKIVEEYEPKAKEKFKPSAQPQKPEDNKPITKEDLAKMSYKELVELSKKFIKEVK
jgi:hypothetical protein